MIGLVLPMPPADALALATKPSLILQTSSVSLTVDPPFFLVDVDDTDSDFGDSCQVQDQVPQGLPEAIEGSKGRIPIPIIFSRITLSLHAPLPLFVT